MYVYYTWMKCQLLSWHMQVSSNFLKIYNDDAVNGDIMMISIFIGSMHICNFFVVFQLWMNTWTMNQPL